MTRLAFMGVCGCGLLCGRHRSAQDASSSGSVALGTRRELFRRQVLCSSR